MKNLVERKEKNSKNDDRMIMEGWLENYKALKKLLSIIDLEISILIILWNRGDWLISSGFESGMSLSETHVIETLKATSAKARCRDVETLLKYTLRKVKKSEPVPFTREILSYKP